MTTKLTWPLITMLHIDSLWPLIIICCLKLTRRLFDAEPRPLIFNGLSPNPASRFQTKEREMKQEENP